MQHVKPHQLLTNEKRARLEQQHGLPCGKMPFVDEVMHMTGSLYQEILDKLHAKKLLWEGFRFGYKRSGTAEMLKMSPSLVLKPESSKSRKTAARSAPGHGKSWNNGNGSRDGLLGYDRGSRRIVHGHALGRTIGVPTINRITGFRRSAFVSR